MNAQLTYREKFTSEMVFGGVPCDIEWIRNSNLFQEGLKKFDSGEWKFFEKEIWKDVKGYEGIYQVSTHGRVKSLNRFVYGKSKRIHKERLLNLITHSAGYNTVRLCKDKKVIACLVHRLVAEAFISNPNKENYVNHINGVREDSHFKNLEWISNRENIVHASLKLRKDKTSIYVGVSKTKKGLPWRASIYHKGKAISLGSYRTEKEAHEAYLAKMEELGIINKYLE
jgi:hypothetical protein